MIQRDPAADRRRASSPALDLGPAREALAQLWRSMLPLLPEDRTAVGIAGVKLRSGTLTTAAQLAIAASELDLGPVLLLEAAARGAALPDCFDAQANPGLLDWLHEDLDVEACIQEIAPSRLSLMTYGSAESLSERSDEGEAALVEALEALRDRFSLVVCDLGPANANGFHGELVAPLDGLLLVVEASRVTDREAKLAKQRLVEAGGRLLGAIWSEAPSDSGLDGQSGGEKMTRR